MNSKFKYAPGFPGFGTRGKDGSTGLQGLSVYFTNMDPINASESINNKISDNKVLWSNNNDSLAMDRIYVNGDIFIDSQGNCYEINADNNTFQDIYTKLSITGLFTEHLGMVSNSGFKRYYNNQLGEKILIDNVHTNSIFDYTATPSKIYNIDTKNFTRFEYCDVSINGYNPFTVFSAAQDLSENHKALAITRNTSTNTFHIGNLDDDNSLRDTNLVLDVKSLMQKKSPANRFSKDTVPGTILSNYEINSNSLFNPIFNTNPENLLSYLDIDDNQIKINWDLTKITSDTDVEASLVFYRFNNKNLSGVISTEIISINDTSFKPIHIHNLDPSGNITISDIDASSMYMYYIQVSKNGWERRTTPRYVINGILELNPDTVDFTKDSSTCTIDVSSNLDWSAAVATGNSFITIDSSTSNSLSFTVTENPGIDREGKIIVSNIGGITKDLNINQVGAIPTVIIKLTPGTEQEGISDTSIDYKIPYSVSITNLPSDSEYKLKVDVKCSIKNLNTPTTSTVEWSVDTSLTSDGMLDVTEEMDDTATQGDSEKSGELEMSNLDINSTNTKLIAHIKSESTGDVEKYNNEILVRLTASLIYSSGSMFHSESEFVTIKRDVKSETPIPEEK